MERALTIGGTDPSGGAGIENDVKVGEVFNVYFHPIVTMITFQTASMFEGGTCVSSETLLKQIRPYLKDVKTWKIGALCNEELANVITELLREFEPMAVTDPVIRASAGGYLYQGDLGKLLEVIKNSYATTPNVIEVEELLGVKIKSLEDVRWVAQELQALGSDLVIITGGHMHIEDNESSIIDYVRWKDKEVIIRGTRMPVNIHGSGSVLATALASLLAIGRDPLTAARYAIGYTRILHRFARKLGDGYVGDALVSLKLAYYRFECHEEYRSFIKWLESLPYEKAKKIAPEVGLNVACTIPKEVSRGVSTIIGVPGRLHLTPDGLRKHCCPWWGGSDHLARLLINAMRYSNYRVVMNIKFTEENVEKLRRMGLKVVEIDRALQPPKTKTMKWLIDYVYERYGEIPQVLYDKGFYGKEAMIRLFARNLSELKTIVSSLLSD